MSTQHPSPAPLRLPDAARSRLLLIGGTLVGAVLFLGCCASASQLRSRTTDEPADAQGLVVEDHFSLGADGAQSHRVLQKILLNTEYAVDKHGDPRIPHNAAQQSFEVLRADTFMRDGGKVSIKPNSVTQTTPDALVTAPAYADMRETVVTLVGLEVGARTELEYVIRDKATSAPLWAEVALHQAYPVAKRQITVQVPDGKTLRWACLGCEVKPEQRNASGASVHSFSWTDLPALNLAELSDHGHGPGFGQPRLVFTTATSWKTLTDDLAQRFSAAAQVDEAVRARAAALTENLATDEQRLMAVWRFVAKTIKTVPWAPADFGFAPSQASRVLQRSYGHSLDKAVLLAALLDAIGLRPLPALVSRDALLGAKVPSLAPFADAWIVVDLAGQLRWLSVTDLQSGGGIDHLEGRYALPLIDRSNKKLPFLIAKTPFVMGEPIRIHTGRRGPERNRSVLVADLELGKEGALKGDFDLTLTGTYNPFVEVAADAGGDKLIDGLLGEVGGYERGCEACQGKVLKLAADGSVFSAVASSKHSGAEGVIEIDLPKPPRSVIAAADLHRPHRQLPLALRSRGIESALVKIAVPDGYALRSKLPAGEVKNKVGSVVTTSRREGKQIVIERVLRLERRIIAPTDYPDLRALAEELWRADSSALLFVKQEAGAES